MSPTRIEVTMTSPAQRLRALHNALVDRLGDDAAATLMEFLPDVPTTELATRTDLAASEGRLIVRMDALHAQTSARIDSLDIQVTTRIEASEQRVLAVMDEQFAEVHKTMNAWNLTFAKQTRAIIFSMAGAVASVTAILIAVLRFT